MLLRQRALVQEGLPEGVDRPKLQLDMSASNICFHMHLHTSLRRNSKKAACNPTEMSNAGGAVLWSERIRVLKMTLAENRQFPKSTRSNLIATPGAIRCGSTKLRADPCAQTILPHAF